MEAIAIIVDIIILVFGILSIILFFKLWKMCDNVKEIAASIKQVAENTQEKVPAVGAPRAESKNKFAAGQLVIVKENEDQFRIDDVTEGKNGGILYYSSKFDKYFTEEELEDFKVYWDSKK